MAKTRFFYLFLLPILTCLSVGRLSLAREPGGSGSGQAAQVILKQTAQDTNQTLHKSTIDLKRALGEGGNLLPILAIAATSDLRAQLQWNRDNGKKITLSTIGAAAEQAAAQTLATGSSWCSYATGICASQGNMRLQKLLADPHSVEFAAIKGFLSRVVLSNVLLIGGFDLGATAWSHAHEMLRPEEQNFELTQFLSQCTSQHWYQTSSNYCHQSLRAFADTLNNLKNIVLFNGDNDHPNERNMVIYDTWRYGIATGTTVSVVGGLTAGGEIGALVGEVPGAILGGAAGGMAAAGLVPERWNQEMTRAFGRGRLNIVSSRLDNCMGFLKAAMQAGEKSLTPSSATKLANYFESDLSACRSIRSDEANILTDRMWNHFYQYNFDIHREMMAAASSQRVVAAEYKVKADEDLKNSKSDLSAIEKFYSHQITAMKRLAATAHTTFYSELLSDTSLDFSEVHRLQAVKDYLHGHLSPLLSPPPPDVDVNLLKSLSVGGYDEKTVLDLVSYCKQNPSHPLCSTQSPAAATQAPTAAVDQTSVH